MNKEPKNLLPVGVVDEQNIYYALEEQCFFCSKKASNYLVVIGAPLAVLFIRQISKMVNQYIGNLPPTINILILTCLPLAIIILTIIGLRSSRRKLQLQPFELDKSGMRKLKRKLWILRGFQWIFFVVIPIMGRVFIESSNFIFLIIYISSYGISTMFIYEYGFWRQERVLKRLIQETGV